MIIIRIINKKAHINDETILKYISYFIGSILFILTLLFGWIFISAGPNPCEVMHDYINNGRNFSKLNQWVTSTVNNSSLWNKLDRANYAVKLFYTDKETDFKWSELGIDIPKQHAQVEMTFTASSKANYQKYKVKDIVDIRLGNSRHKIIYEINQHNDKKQVSYKSVKLLCGNKIETIFGESKGNINIVDVGD